MNAQIVVLKISTGQKINLCVFIFMYGYRSDRGCLTEGELKLYFCSWHIMVVSLGGQACTLCSQLIILGFASQTCRCSLGSTERAITVTWQERHHTKFCCKQIKKLPFSYAIFDMDPTILVHFPILCCTFLFRAGISHPGEFQGHHSEEGISAAEGVHFSSNSTVNLAFMEI